MLVAQIRILAIRRAHSIIDMNLGSITRNPFFPGHHFIRNRTGKLNLAAQSLSV